MADYTFVTTRLATGGALADGTDVAALAAANITHVIDCRNEFDDAPLLGPPFTYLWNGVEDDGLPKPPEWFGSSIEFALDALTHRGARLYVHCLSGMNRGPSTAFAIMVAQGWTPTEAAAQIRRLRPVVTLVYQNDAVAACAALGYT